MNYFHWEEKINRGRNTSVITLIPKIDDPQVLPDYRPINLIVVINKVICKVLANRLQSVIGNVISDSQLAYIEGRRILYGPLVINEAMGQLKKSKTKAMLLKIDLVKAFDSLNWGFLMIIMSHMNFPQKRCNCILAIHSSSRFSILVSGAPTREFSIKCGVKQGEPLSPFLFIITMEALNIVMNKAIQSGLEHP